MHAALKRSGGVEAVARRLAIPTPAADRIAAALLPVIQAAFRNRIGPAGAEADVLAIEDMLAGFGGSRMAAHVLNGASLPAGAATGLVHALFATEAATTAVIDDAASAGAGEPAQVAAALPVLTMLVGGYLAAQIASVEDIDAGTVQRVLELLEPRAAGAAPGGTT